MSITSTMVEADILGLAKPPVVISGNLGAGNVLTSSLRAGFSATGFQWTRNGSDISGQTASTYTQLTSDRGSVIGCRAIGLAYAGSAGTVPVVVPGAPTGVSATAGDGSVTGTFTAPTDNGGSAITGYQMAVYRASDNVLLGTATGSASPLTLSGLTNGVAVYVTLSAMNAIGLGNQSSASSVVTPTVVQLNIYNVNLAGYSSAVRVSYAKGKLIRRRIQNVGINGTGVGESIALGFTTNANSNRNPPATFAYTVPLGQELLMDSSESGKQIYGRPLTLRSISAISVSGNNITVTSTAHGLAVGRRVTLVNNAPSALNIVNRRVTAIVDANNFTVDTGTAQSEATTLGSWVPSDLTVRVIEELTP